MSLEAVCKNCFLKLKTLKHQCIQYIKENKNSREFIKNISEVFVYKVVVYFISMLIIILAARNVNTSEFGFIGLINSISYLLFVPMILGVHSSMYKYLPVSTEDEKSELMLSSMIGNFISIILFSFIYLGMYKILIQHLNIPFHQWKIGVVITVIVSLSALSESYLRGQKKFSSICRFKLVTSVVNLVLVLILFFLLHQKSFESYFLSFAISQLLFSALSLKSSGIRLCKISNATLKKVYTYGLTNTLSMFLGGIIFSSDLFFINYFCSSSTVGIYNAYQGFVKNIFSVLFYEIFLVVFLPFIAQSNDHAVKYRLRRSFPLILMIVLIGSGISTSIFILLFGSQYKLNFVYVALSSLAIALYTIYQLNCSTYTMEGSRNAFIAGIAITLVLPFSMVIQFFTTKYWEVSGALIGVVLTNLLLLISFEVVFRCIPHKYRTR